MSLTIYKASAGSGKTYTLAKEYLRLALRSEDYYKKILAVTFTNRAAEEMKERVLEFLIGISKGKHELIKAFSNELSLTEDDIKYRASEALNHLLHNYGYFSITTIDTFFHQVIRSFSREIGLQGSFGIELDIDKVSDLITSDLYQGIEDNDQLREWLVDFSMSQLSDGKGYEYKKEVSQLARQLFSEEFKKLPKDQFEDNDAKTKIKDLKDQLNKKRFGYEDALKKMGQNFFDKQLLSGIELDEFTGGKKRTIPNFFNRLISGDATLNKTMLSAADSGDNWSTKTSKKRDLIIQFAEQLGIPLLNEVIEYVDTNEKDYLTAKTILKHLFTLGLMTDLSQRLQEYKKEEELIMISDLPDFLSQIIDDTGSPFIYEKVGRRYHHFLIDEFQDTSQLQWKNFKPLLEESLSYGNENLIVGDAKQSIYGWRGGDPSLLMEGVQEDLPIAQVDSSKSVNYRSAKNVVEFNNQLFSTLPSLMSELMSDVITDAEMNMIHSAYDSVQQEVAPYNKSVDGLVQLEFLRAERGEKWNNRSLERTVDEIESLLDRGCQLNDMAILVRSNWEATQIVNYVLDYRRNNETSIEVISAEGMLLANSSVVQLLLSAFKHLLNPDDGSVIADLAYRYQQLSKGMDFSIHDDFMRLNENGLPVAFQKFKQHLLHLPILELTEVLIRNFELNKVAAEFAYLQAFQDAILEFSKNQRSDIGIFMDWWADAGAKRSVQLTGALDAVEVITSHKAKGLQYPIVFVPFCNFDFDSKTHPSWYEAPDDETSFGSLKSLPVDYKSELDKTIFSPRYKQELAKWHLESLNVLYVAFTRAENGLYVFCQPPPKEKKSMYGSASKLLWTFFERNDLEGWSEEAMIFKKGSLLIQHTESKDNLISLSGYPTNKWSNKLSIRKTGKAYYDDEVEQQRNEGILLHQILSEIIHWEQTDKVLDRYEKRMEITSDDRKAYEVIIKNLWNNGEVKRWFEGGHEVKTEVVVLPKDGETKRMDRVMIDGNKVKVIDFKSGQPKKQDEKQLKEYTSLLKGMGYEASGHLLYLKTGETRSL